MESSNFTDRVLTIIENAQTIAQDQSHTQLLPLHVLAAMTEPEKDGSPSYLKTIIEKSRFDWQVFLRTVNKNLVRLPSQSPPPDKITPSYSTAQVLQKAEKYKKSQKDSYIGQDHILLALLDDSQIAQIFKESNISNLETIRNALLDLRGNKKIDSKVADTTQQYEFLSKYAINLTEQARQGKLDPVIGREEEIRRTIRVLSRRTKSNPCLIGDPGVGKTSIVEGVALRIIDSDVPTVLQNCKLYSLDVTALRAGAKFQGEFEERVKGVLKDIEDSKEMIILFIDEIHMIMGDNNSAANLLKPMLARGSLHCIGATTITEYRKYVEKDGAFERRFQKIDVKEPNVREATAILRGLAPKYEIHHGVRILDSALVTAAVLAKRYLTYRKLPDSAVDLIDESAATVAVARDSKPEELDMKERQLQLIQVEIKALQRDIGTDASTKERLEQAKQKEASLEDELRPLRERFNQEKAGHEQLTSAKRKLDELEIKASDAERRHDTTTAADLRYFAIPDVKNLIAKLEEKVAEEEKDLGATAMIQNVVGSEQVAETAARLTGIPVSKLTQTENLKLINMEKELSAHVVGQSQAVKAVANGIRLTRSGLANPNQPASFLFLGLSGSGKTELAKKLAGFLFNDEKAMIRIDCSELSDKWSSSKLLGSAPGYVGYEEGGILSNGLARQPYSVVLFDEIEKAAPEVLTIFLQLLDDGRITSSAGKTIDCSNCIVIMTSNLGAEYILSSRGSKVTLEVKELVLNVVKTHFRPEFLNRISETIVFNKLSRKAIEKIIKIRLEEITERFVENNKNIKLDVSEDAIEWLCRHGYSEDLGARPLNRLIQTEILNRLAILILKNQILNKEVAVVELNPNGRGLIVLPNHEVQNEEMDVDVDEWNDENDEDWSDDGINLD
ncbi:chaperone ATPase HSP104 [Ascoidea rubescens DSM 1968]|uniref:p-loop containing nucleoside triphosphate hydrolase protein n=1 Tax=Ascoidea rubescens DSM 1968 TaxID=1344418 RepID=A0A1D2VB79_9ASCO|nr:P-loop containing nucleoside triphosphate hydrolase protein [Ascoidea rubescens DSM 1968]ODV58723.1 P-loop containing nucleoside triphosphate hydrolase protein [Ascoidea rubescens DSM 1968]